MTDISLKKVVSPYFVYNRMADDMELLLKYEVKYDNKIYEVNGFRKENDITLGVWLYDIPKEAVVELCKDIFANEKKVKKITLSNYYYKLGDWKQKNHFRIELPETVESLNERISKKNRYNIQREFRLLNEEQGTCVINEYESNEVPDEVFSAYFKMKKRTHNVDYNMTAQEYINHYRVSNIYTLSVGSTIVAEVLSCEQCPIVYIENLTYNTDYSKYSPGKYLYNYYLQRLIEKGKREIYLAGGKLDYKRRYGSIEETVYDCTIYRNSFMKFYNHFIHILKKFVKKLIGR